MLSDEQRRDLVDRYTSVARVAGEETDRGATLVLAEDLSNQLESLLRAVVVTEMSRGARKALFSGNGPLATFSSRTEVAFAFGFISPRDYHDLRLVRKVRNLFAHSTDEASFSDPSVATMVDQLEFARREDAKRIAESMSRLSTGPANEHRVLFGLACGVLKSRLQLVAMQAARFTVRDELPE